MKKARGYVDILDWSGPKILLMVSTMTTVVGGVVVFAVIDKIKGGEGAVEPAEWQSNE